MPSNRAMQLGSSPPVRGARGGVHLQLKRAGLIPARAGSTRSTVHAPAQGRAHPRPCGEHNEGSAKTLKALGSSPPVRGALSCGSTTSESGGLIPARAGSTYWRSHCPTSSRAHPRPCGEHVLQLLRLKLGMGSSPPVRGARAHV